MRAAWPHPRWIAHRGGGILAPENTLAGLHAAARAGYRAVEFDVMLTGDGTPVLMHDETLERTTDGRGRVDQWSDAEIGRLDAGRWHGAAFAGEPVPTFAAAADLCLALGLWANVEIKPCSGHERETGRIVARLARELWSASGVQPLLSSFSGAALEEAGRVAPELPRGLLFGRIPRDWFVRMSALGCRALHCNYRRLSPVILDSAASHGVPVVCYTVNDPDEARRLLAAGVSALITDRLDLLPSGAAVGAEDAEWQLGLPQ